MKKYQKKLKRIKEIAPIKKQLIKFTLIGLLAVLVDLSFYYVLLIVLPEKLFSVISNEAFSKSISFICGMGVTYFFNKFWTWRKNDHSRKRVMKFAILYGLSLIINVSTNSLFLYLLHESKYLILIPFKYFVAFVGATGISSIVNFVGQKYWVFKSFTFNDIQSQEKFT